MKRLNGMTRREFIAVGAGLAGAAAMGGKAAAGGRAFGAPSGPRHAAQASIKSRVVLVRTDSRADGVKKCIDLLGLDPFKGKRVLVKPNFNTSDECPGSTHNDTLVALLARIREMGATTLSIGDRSGPEPTEQVFEKKGIPAIAGQFDAKLLNFDELGETGYVPVDPPASHWKDGFLVARPVVATESVVSTCCLKTHQFGGVFSMSLKNSVGIVPRKGHRYMSQLHGSKENQRRMIAEINTAYKPALIVLDGLDGLRRPGPDDRAAQGRRRLPGRHGPRGRRRRRRWPSSRTSARTTPS